MKPAIEKATRKQFPEGIAAFGTDALRLCFASLATMSRDLRFDMVRVDNYRHFCNKLWNAARFVLMNVEGHDNREDGAQFSLADRWIQSRLAATLVRVESGFSEYRLDNVASALYDFIWHEYCDWYVELSKSVLQSESATDSEKRTTRWVLVHCLEVALRALHPLAPFISEEIWQRVRAAACVPGETVMRSAYPAATSLPTDAAAESEMRWVMDFILGVRQIRGEMDIAPSRKLDCLLQNAGALDRNYLERNSGYLKRLAGLGTATVLEPAQAAPIAAVALLGKLEILVPMAGLIDPAAELERLAKRQRKAEADRVKLQAKLTNVEFSRNAPAEVVAKDQARLEELHLELDQLAAQVSRVTALRAQ